MIMVKKIWLFALPILAILITGLYFLFFQEWIMGPTPQYVMQTIAADSKTARTISWQTEVDQVGQMLSYREVAAKGAEHTVDADAEELTTSAEPMTLHTVKLTGLRQGTAYEYRVGSATKWSEWQTFTTESQEDGEFSAIVFGDSQSCDYGIWEKTAQSAWLHRPDAAFFINMGDLVDIGSHYDQWKAWLAGARGMISSIPVAPISGNHENYLPGGTFSPADLYLELFRLPDNGPENLPGQAYAFDYGNVHFAALDSQAEELSAFEPDLIKQEAAWLERDLQQSNKPWKVVLIHRNLFINSGTGEPNELGKVFLPIFDRYQVDVVFTAHIHTYGRTKPLYASKIAEHGERGTIYISTGRSGDKTWDGSKQKYFETVFDRALDQPNYLILESGANLMKITNFKQDGVVVDTVELKK